ncbi:uncharacterized protein LY89DRAFT_409294 [Mollisia scopiformis]|uniref:2EXR domain-containing protein n=1 Tax=Mollisia scopiformis TaxID=149040 RepID=A0A132B257_MOLSC|nr:uncharacterized protein LY89DRAFT_409294 [Mollisia scopiformis]KUJ06462.1 hypothetical protein LY89DRAFT_409294 [Mollisia scopiformis]
MSQREDSPFPALASHYLLQTDPQREYWHWGASGPKLRAELMRRGLAQDGSKIELKERIAANDKWGNTKEGRIAIYNRQLADLEAERRRTAPEIVPFERFKSLPKELRMIVWELALPGPRILSVSDHCEPGRLRFRKHDSPPNPVALSVCRESRHVALLRYRLCFGTTNIYADLARDVLYFGSRWRDFRTFVLREGHDVFKCIANPGVLNIYHGERWKPALSFSDTITADLKVVQRLAVASRIWAVPYYRGRRRAHSRFWPGTSTQSYVLRRIERADTHRQ